MPQIDRLSALIAHFTLRVTPAPAGAANLAIRGEGAGRRIVLTPRDAGRLAPPAGALTARLDWGGDANPLLAALPARVELSVGPESEDAHLVTLFEAEAAAMRCGAGPVLDRLCEVIVIRLMRAEIARGNAEPGLLAGLADPRLARAITAMHEAPGRGWTLPDLAGEAGMSPSRFAEVFRETMGETPLSYLRRWRMALARQDLTRGERVQAVARRYGYASGEALTRAFRKAHGQSPRGLRQAASAVQPAASPG